MKRIALLVALTAISLIAYCQPRALGLRLGTALEVSYQHGLHSGNMLSVDAGLCHVNGIEAAITHDWVNPGGADFSKVWSGRGTWNWYAGVGGALGFYWPYNDYASGFFIGVAGRIGVEYNFWFPLQLSIDYRPVIGGNFTNSNAAFYNYGLYSGAIALGVRYHF